MPGAGSRLHYLADKLPGINRMKNGNIADFAQLLADIKGELRLSHAEICAAVSSCSRNAYYLPDTRLRDWKVGRKLPDKDGFRWLCVVFESEKRNCTLPEANKKRIESKLSEFKQCYASLKESAPERKRTRSSTTKHTELKLWQVALKDVMQRTAISDAELAKLLGVSHDFFDRWANNRLRPSEKNRYPAELQTNWLKSISDHLHDVSENDTTIHNHCDGMMKAFAREMNISNISAQR